MSPFWYVMVEGSGPPRVKHDTQHSAEVEAERLARQCPGRNVLVLKAIATVIRSDIRWDWVHGEQEIPF